MVAAIAAGIGAVGSIAGGMMSKSGSKAAAQQALTGYNYLTGDKGVQPYVNNGLSANSAQAQLLGLSPMTSGTQNGFNNYLNSSGYNFMLDSGSKAITGNAAFRGILNSGSTAKALTQYGQDVGSQYFDNYLSNLNNVSGQGLTATGQIGAAGSAGGEGAAKATQAGSNSMASGVSSAGGILANFVGGL